MPYLKCFWVQAPFFRWKLFSKKRPMIGNIANHGERGEVSRVLCVFGPWCPSTHLLFWVILWAWWSLHLTSRMFFFYTCLYCTISCWTREQFVVDLNNNLERWTGERKRFIKFSIRNEWRIKAAHPKALDGIQSA